jgi:hypothetical protein
MVQRCTYQRHAKYPMYGAVGITICNRWLAAFENFLEDMGERPEGTTLDRVDGAKLYSKDTCRWATPKQQVEHRSPESFAKHNLSKTACPMGHPYAGGNLGIRKNGNRVCRACGRERARVRRAS